MIDYLSERCPLIGSQCKIYERTIALRHGVAAKDLE
jgi:hypothetical protein